LKGLLVAAPATPLHNPYICIGIKRRSTEADLQHTWEYILQKAPFQSPFVTFIKSDGTGRFIGFQSSGDGALAARDCYLLAYGDPLDRVEYVNYSLNFATYRDESKRVAKDYTFDLSDWKVDKVVSE
jgi:hypothetical protein